MALLDIDQRYRQFVTELSETDARVAEALPYRLGLVEQRDGRFSDYVQLLPLRELPTFAESSMPDAALDEAALDRYRLAHYHAGYFGLLIDRLADRQSKEQEALLPLRQPLLDAWCHSLAAATGNATLAEQAIVAALAAWRRGIGLEREAMTGRRLSVAQYVELVGLKVAWIETASLCRLLRGGEPTRARDFALVVRLLLLSSQCLDDVKDAAEDESLHGLSFPAALNLPSGALVRAAPKLAELGAKLAQEAGFVRLADWMFQRATALTGLAIREDVFQCELGALLITETARSRVQAMRSQP